VILALVWSGFKNPEGSILTISLKKAFILWFCFWVRSEILKYRKAPLSFHLDCLGSGIFEKYFQALRQIPSPD